MEPVFAIVGRMAVEHATKPRETSKPGGRKQAVKMPAAKKVAAKKLEPERNHR